MMVILVKQSIAYIFDQKNRPNRKLKKPEVIKLKQVKIMFVLMKNLNILKMVQINEVEEEEIEAEERTARKQISEILN